MEKSSTKIEESSTKKRHELLEEYFAKSTDLQLAKDGKHPDYMGRKISGKVGWLRYVTFINAGQRKLKELKTKINKL